VTPPREAAIATHRRATLADAVRLFDLRRAAILAIATGRIPPAAVHAWAANLTRAGMESKLREMEIWVAERDGHVVAWGAIRDDRLEGLYTEPGFASQGVGTALLAMLETLMCARGVREMRADASSNAVAFYLRRGYRVDAPPSGGAQSIVKRLA